ncbi:serine-rich adhesin for platelets-like isoform X1 [Bactrocera neohumeralis]|uniref:serine-rich adhesin for platelets-like isoform X1 n=1 Tax=Bactrocera neohumeralis TaxID=98809 RepID=UPI00216662A2|nr:serine-rich adhesin for platelets-like isoform X1 [Bactrocera neohumeralis]
MSNALQNPVDIVSLARNSSDSHIERLNAQKNESKLFLIKSYSFIDKSLKSHALPQKSKQRAENFTSFRHIDALLLHAATAKPPASAKNEQNKTNAKAKAQKCKAHKTDSDEDEDLRALLRHPSVIMEGVESEMHVRPKSMPSAAMTNTRPPPDPAASPPPTGKSNKSKQNDFKRESFLRHSLQSIRRSFSSHKKFAGFGHNATNANATNKAARAEATKTCSSSSSSSSSSTTSTTSSTTSTASAASRHSGSNGIACSKSEKVGIIIKLNDNTACWADGTGEIGCCDIGSVGSQRKLRARGKELCASVSTFATTPNDSTSMAPLQRHAETQSVTILNLQDKETSPNSSNSSSSSRTQLTQKQKQQQHKRQSSNQSDNYNTAYSTTSDSSTQNLNNYRVDVRSLNTIAPIGSTASTRSLSPTSRKSATNTTAKHEQSTAAATAAAAATTAVPAEKEKKRKEVSSSRVKKFHRHFTQVSKDEKLINYFSCALVSDILLQGHLYITDQHFAFYSNVFGYVTKVVIPTSSVTKISKEKLAKIIPNAVGVATADERHVFGSFMSREAAFRLMCSVCPPLAPIENLPKAPADIEISEEYSIEDDSSCSISGNESPPQALVAAVIANAGEIDEIGQTLIQRNVAGSSVSIADGTAAANENHRHSDIPTDAKQAGAFSNTNMRASAPPSARYNSNHGKTASGADGTPIANASSSDGMPTAGIALIVTGTNTSGSSSPTPSTSSSLPITVMGSTPKSAAHAAVSSFKTLTQKALLRLKFPKELHVVYLGVLLTMVLALFSVFLLYRILDIEAKTSAYRSPNEFNWRAGTDDDIFAEALRWQKELQAKSTEEAQDILTHNLEQIAKVRRSLETLSMLIHDRSSAHEQRDESD